MIKKIVKEVRKNLFKIGYQEVNDTEVKSDDKTKARYRIENEVFDTRDSVADNAKMISLLITVTSRMYGVMSEESKANLQTEERAMIEGVFEKFATITTRADLQFAQEGMAMVDKILERQEAVSEVLK